MGSRRKARELALQFLYKLDVSGEKFTRDGVARFFEEFGGKDEDPDYAVILIENTLKHGSEIDREITERLENWTLERLSTIDRNILRFATCELRYFLDVPVNVTINEAIEIAKKFSLEESATFINGVLDKIAKDTAKG
ncbi:MAG TPA: transcription antitermination factor NusB [Nitrospirota bacterium]|nr:transcription antitermination factor NusB [Nitrospirota bacterium]